MAHKHDQPHSCADHGLSRREFVQVSSRIAWAGLGASALVAACAPGKSRPGDSAVKQSGGVRNPDPTLKIGYLPICDATPLLIGHGQKLFEAQGLQVDAPVLIRGWAELSEAFLAGTFNLVHLLLPLPIYMRFSQNLPVKVVAWNHMNGSAITVGMKSGIHRLEELGGKQIAVPHWYSMHNVILQRCLREYGLEAVIQDRNAPLKKNQTNLFVMKPPDMPTAISNGAIDGYIVAEPFNAAGETLAKGTIVRFTGDVFKNHPCCVAVMREADIQQHPEWSQRVLNGLVNAQRWALEHPQETSTMLSKDGAGYLPLPQPVIQRAMTKYDIETYGLNGGTGAIRHPEWNAKRIGFQPYPFESTTREIVQMLKQTKLEGDSAFLQRLDQETVVRDLFDYTMVRQAAQAAGGLQLFDGIDAANPAVRSEIIRV